MCLYITATLPREAKLNCVAPIFNSYKLSFEVISNPYVLKQLHPGDVYISTTSSHCDCGSALGSLSKRGSDAPESYEDELKKLRRKGWSEAKIRRWLEQKEQTKETHIRRDEARAGSETPVAQYWVDFISAVLNSQCTDRVGILLHFYHMDVEGERIKILSNKRVKLEYLTPRLLMEMEYDVIYEFVP
jgi:hypothetical protein